MRSESARILAPLANRPRQAEDFEDSMIQYISHYENYNDQAILVELASKILSSPVTQGLAMEKIN